MAVAGLVRLRKHQFGRQSSMGTKVTPKRAYGFKGVPDNNRGWTDPEVDSGALAPVQAPYLTAPELTAPLTTPALRYNDLPLIFTGFFGGGVDSTGSGDAQTYDFDIDAEAPSEPDPYTYEFGDDRADDWFQLGDSVVESAEITAPDGGGALTASVNWREGSFASNGSSDNGASPAITTGLALATDEAIVYLKDAKIFLTSDPDDLDTAQISDALHTFTLRLGGPLDLKRWANGTQSFDIAAYSRTMLDLQLECSFAKTDDIVGTGSESDAWESNSAVTRYVRVAFESLANAETGPDVPYTWEFSGPIRYYTRTEGEIGGNTVVVLTGHFFYEPTDFAGLFKTNFVTTLDSTTDL